MTDVKTARDVATSRIERIVMVTMDWDDLIDLISF